MIAVHPDGSRDGTVRELAWLDGWTRWQLELFHHDGNDAIVYLWWRNDRPASGECFQQRAEFRFGPDELDEANATFDRLSANFCPEAIQLMGQL